MLIQGSNATKERCDEVPCCLCFLEYYCLLLGLVVSSSLNGKHVLPGLPGLSVPFLTSFLSHQHNILVLTLSFSELPCTVGPLGFWVHGALPTLHANRMQEWQTWIVYSSAHLHVPLFPWTSLLKHKFKDKISKTFKMVTAAHLTKLWALLSMGLSGTADQRVIKPDLRCPPAGC